MTHGYPPWKKGLFHHIAFHSGRILGYGFLGILSAVLFQTIGLTKRFPGGMTLLGGGFMILLGLLLLKILPLPGSLILLSTGFASFWKRLFPLFQSRHMGSKVVLGLATGFLPCGLSWAMILKSATTADIGEGFLTMVSFGLGTVPALILIGFSASFLSLRVRFLGERVAALAVIIMGLILIYKGAIIFV